jgi:Holliday junction resolvase RusA-like endonuclease
MKIESVSLQFITPLPPSTNNAYANVNGRRVKTKVATEFTERVGDIVVAAKAVAGAIPAPPFSLRLDVWFPDQGRRDISNTIKLLEDSLMRAIDQDDRHVHLLVVRRCGVDRWNARVEVALEHIEPVEATG